MTARGDLAVELGYERIAEMQRGDPLAMRGRARTGYLGHSSARGPGEGYPHEPRFPMW